MFWFRIRIVLIHVEVNWVVLEHILEQEHLQIEAIRNSSFAFMSYLSLVHINIIVKKVSWACPQYF